MQCRVTAGVWQRKSVKVSDDGVAANDVLVLSYSNKTTMEISKAQLVAFLTDEDTSGLVDEYTWQGHSRRTSRST